MFPTVIITEVTKGTGRFSVARDAVGLIVAGGGEVERFPSRRRQTHCAGYSLLMSMPYQR